MENKTTEWMSGPAPTVCRCCLAEGCYKDISTEYFWMGKREVYAEMLSETFDLSIAYAQTGGPNSHSRLICEPCISRLRDASEFKKQVQECEKTFINHLDPCSTTVTVEIEPSDQVKLETVKEEQKHSDSEDFDDRLGFEDDDDDLDDQPLTKLASKPLKKEKADLLDLLDNSQAPVKRKSTLKAKAPPAKKAKLKIKEKAKPSPSKAPTKTPKKKKGIIVVTNSSITLKNKDGSDRKLTMLKTPISLRGLDFEVKKHIEQKLKKINDHLENDDTLSRSPENVLTKTTQSKMVVLKDPIPLDKLGGISQRVKANIPTRKVVYRPQRSLNVTESQLWKHNALTVFTNSHVYPFVHIGNKYKCFVCSASFLNSNLLKDHTKDHSRNDIMKALNRARDKCVKVDVSCLQCKLCTNTLEDLHSLKVHLREHNKKIDPDLNDNMIPFKLGSDEFDCQVCGEKFLKLRMLVIHMSKHFNNYSCEICGSLFISQRLLNSHFKSHETGSFPCDKCDKVFSNSVKRTVHIQGVHLKKFPRRCPICPERFNCDYQRTKHLRTVHNQSTKIFKCETCGREYDLHYHLMLHIRSVHLKERNQQCALCNATFFSKSGLSRHMVIHTGVKPFKCEVCGKAYARKKSWKEHVQGHEQKPSVCTVCGKECADPTALMAHMNANHGVVFL